MNRASASASDVPIQRFGDLARVAGDWRRLELEAGNPFSTHAWATAWWHNLGEGCELRVVRMADRDGGALALVPLSLETLRGVRVLRFVGHGPADELGPVCAPADREQVARRLLSALAEWDDWDVFLAERLAGNGWSDLLGGRTLRREPSPEIAIDTTDWDEFLNARSSNFRQQVRKFERRLVRDHDLSFRLADDPDRLDRDMTIMFELHDARWGGKTTAFPESLKPFHRELAALALEQGFLRLVFAELEGRPAAVWYGFRLGGADWFYQQGRDPAWERASVGFVLAAHTIREAVAAGIAHYRFLLGGEDYKARFATSEPEVETLAISRGSRGRAATAGVRLLTHLPGPLRHPLRRFADTGAKAGR
jgi:CelD/BcsL family acetyltransferase involved in cellulose biosynthesis